MTTGYVYILSNPSMPDLIKIGYTDICVYERANDLSRVSGVPTPFEVEHYREMKNARDFEQGLHRRFRRFRINGNREFFEMSAAPVIKLLDGVKLSKREKAAELELLKDIRREKRAKAKAAKEARIEAERLAKSIAEYEAVTKPETTPARWEVPADWDTRAAAITAKLNPPKPKFLGIF